MEAIYQQFINGMLETTWLEFIAVVFGIVSVWYSRKENILVYPVGLVNTLIYIWISVKAHLFGEASVNIYYSLMSVYGWVLWSKRDSEKRPVIHITYSNSRQWLKHITFFLVFYIVLFICLTYLQKHFATGAVPALDALASATAFTGMWLMAKKKVESWYWWIATNIASIPLYFSKGYVFTSFYYLVLLVMAIGGLLAWMEKSKQHINRLEMKRAIQPESHS